MMRWLSIGVIVYMIAGIIWWGLLLYQKNEALFQLQLSEANPTEQTAINQEYRKQRLMIISEGLILGLSLFAGIYIIYRSAKREIKTVQNQNNFVLSVSHELKSPIAAIKLAFETLNRKNLPQEKAQQIRASGIKDSDRLEQLVQNLLLSASIDENRLELYKERIDLAEYLSPIIKTYQATYRGQIHLEMEEEIKLDIDQNAMERAISNVLQNASKYATPDSDINIQVQDSDTHIDLNITNQGPSISDKEKALVFDRFFRGKDDQIRTKEGTGIGLYVSKEILQVHGGDISVDNTVPGYTTFLIRIPKHD